jgi:hypothetical protein
MQRVPSWEANSSTDSHSILLVLRKVHYSVHNSPQTVPILGQINPFYGLTAETGMKVQLISYLSSAKHEGEWSAFGSGRFNNGERNAETQ